MKRKNLIVLFLIGHLFSGPHFSAAAAFSSHEWMGLSEQEKVQSVLETIKGGVNMASLFAAAHQEAGLPKNANRVSLRKTATGKEIRKVRLESGNL